MKAGVFSILNPVQIVKALKRIQTRVTIEQVLALDRSAISTILFAKRSAHIWAFIETPVKKASE